MTNNSDNKDAITRQYMTLVPRGLHFAAEEWVKERITLTHSICEPEQPPDYYTHKLIAENKAFPKKDLVVSSVGTLCVQDSVQRNQDMSVGYNAQQKVIWTKTGQHSSIWWQFSSSAAQVSSLRAIGPVTALVGSWSFESTTTTNETLEDMAMTITSCLQTDLYRNEQLPSALRTWKDVALSNWNNVSSRIRGFSLEEDLFTSPQELKFRVSCLRPDAPTNTYSRRDLIMAVANDLVPKAWSVDLKNYDVEIVLFLRENQFAIGLALHPYQLIRSNSFAGGIVPPDLAPPYIVPTGIVRLRPATAQLLLHLADLKKPGSIVLDPCVGIGTIAHECAYYKYVGLGGDIVLTPSLLAPQAVTYSTAIRNEQHQVAATLVAWDAANLPIRTGIVDAVVSDLPFGRQCLSSSKLQQLLPLMMNEMARVLQPCSGKMVLLCGHYKVVIEVLEEINTRHGSTIWQFPCSAVIPVNIGGMLAWVVQIQRGSGAWQSSTFSSEKVRKLTAMREIARRNPSAKKKKLQR